LEILKTPLEGLIVVKPMVFKDDRGYFYESFNQKSFENAINKKVDFVQDNQSLSQQNVVRGLHFQQQPFAQAKLVRVIQGAVLDVAVDIRKNSPTFGQHYKCELSAENFLQMFIPEGFAHGFLTLQPNTLFLYKCSNFYNKSSEGCLLWNDPDINIDWGIDNPLVSEKDNQGELFKHFSKPFN
jgi:dTDP-4-dehydrorhamnose 3,5-epimerase